MRQLPCLGCVRETRVDRSSPPLLARCGTERAPLAAFLPAVALRAADRRGGDGVDVLQRRELRDRLSPIAYGKGGETASNRRDEQEMFVLYLRILQSALVYVNTLMLQDILGEPSGPTSSRPLTGAA
ncbi:Tn3 family transposase [Streptomyces sp. NPDC047974]|uniref:Tn3 family transposase n=1 Tax=Streptomyces sp. NPDC047974 TaxID=3154343 RepID=UPI0033F38E68